MNEIFLFLREVDLLPSLAPNVTVLSIHCIEAVLCIETAGKCIEFGAAKTGPMNMIRHNMYYTLLIMDDIFMTGFFMSHIYLCEMQDNKCSSFCRAPLTLHALSNRFPLIECVCRE